MTHALISPQLDLDVLRAVARASALDKSITFFAAGYESMMVEHGFSEGQNRPVP